MLRGASPAAMEARRMSLMPCAVLEVGEPDTFDKLLIDSNAALSLYCAVVPLQLNNPLATDALDGAVVTVFMPSAM